MSHPDEKKLSSEIIENNTGDGNTGNTDSADAPAAGASADINKNEPPAGETFEKNNAPAAGDDSEKVELLAGNDGYTSIFDAPAPKEKKTDDKNAATGKKKHKPSRQLSLILVTVLVCVALVGGIFAVIRFTDSPDDTGSDASSSSGVQCIYDYTEYLSSADDTEYLNIGGITGISVKNRKTSYKCAPVKEISTTTDESTGETKTTEILKWHITELEGVDIEGINFDPSLLKYVLVDIVKTPYSGIYAQDINAEIPSGGMTYFEECGFDDPEGEFNIEFADGSAITYYIGDATPTKDGYFTYADCRPNENTVESVTADGEVVPILGRPVRDTKVYKATEDAVSYLFNDATVVVSRDVVNKFTESGGADYYSSGTLIKYDSIELYSQTLGKTLHFSCVEAGSPASSSIYFVDAPENFSPDTKKIDDLLSPLADGLRSAGCYELRDDSEKSLKYGFDSPIGRVVYKVGDKTVGITVAKGIEVDYYAVKVDGDVSIYKVATDKLGFMHVAINDWRNPLLYANNIINVDSIEMRVKDSSGNVSVTNFVLEHTSDDEGDDQITVTANGKTVDTEVFRSMYSSIISTSIEGEYVTDGKESASPELQITVRYIGYDGYDVLKYSDYSARRYYFTLNGKDGAPVLSTLVETIKDKYFKVIG